MQNRLVLTVPSHVPSLPGAADALRDLVERHGCWVDRFAFLDDDFGAVHTDGAAGGDGGGDESESSVVLVGGDGDGGVVAAFAAELHLENVRDGTVAALDGRTVAIGADGGAESEDDNVAAFGGRNEEDDGPYESLSTGTDTTTASFRIRAAPATRAQGRRLAELCPIEDDPGERAQTLHLPHGVRLTVGRSACGGGTGADPWRGGVLLASQLCSWLGGGSGNAAAVNDDDAIAFPTDALFRDKDVLELGAGAAGLPSMALAALSNRADSQIVPRSIIASDGIDEIVDALRLNVHKNGLMHFVGVRHVDWNALPAVDNNYKDPPLSADTILFADCVYNEEGASALCGAIDSLLRPGGDVVGVLPDFRVGLSSFEAGMRRIGFRPADVPMEIRRVGDVVGPGAESELDDATVAKQPRFCCAGSGGKNYRTIWWKDCRNNQMKATVKK